jgi:hypothetical protein
MDYEKKKQRQRQRDLQMELPEMKSAIYNGRLDSTKKD